MNTQSIFLSFFKASLVTLLFTSCEVVTLIESPDSSNPSQPSSSYGTLDVTQPWQGNGEYTGYNAGALTTNQICPSAQLFGSAGTAVCQSGATSTPASTTDVISGKDYWNSSGTLQSGGITLAEPTFNDIGDPFNTTLNVTAPANTLWKKITIDLGTDFTSQNFCAGKTIFGRAGSATCGTTTESIDHLIPSHVHRNQGSGRASLKDEINLSSYTGYSLIPRVNLDDEGINSPKIMKGNRPTKVCGLDFNTVQDRINNCILHNGADATWDGKVKGITGEANWSLVTYLDVGGATNGSPPVGTAYEVWQDQRTGLLWSDAISTATNWCQAAGVTSNVGGVDCTPGGGLQPPATPISLCAEIPGFIDSDSHEAKGKLSIAPTPTQPGIIWRLPTINDWKQADLDGIRYALTHMEDTVGNTTGSCDYSSIFCTFWSATTYAKDKAFAHVFSGEDGTTIPLSFWLPPRKVESTAFFTRCVGSEAP